MARELAVAEAKATLSELIRVVEAGEVVVIRRHGKPVAALVGPAEVAQLERLRAAGPAGGLASVAGGWPGSEGLAQQVATGGRAGQRHVARLD